MDDAATHYHPAGAVVLPSAPRRRRDGWRLWILLVAALLLPAAILGTGAWGAWHLTWTETERDLVRGATVNADYVERNLRSLARTAGRIAALSATARDAPAATLDPLQRDILDMVREQPLVTAVAVLDAMGQPLLQVAVPAGAPDAADPPGGGIVEALARAAPGRIAVGRAYGHGDGKRFAIGVRGAADGRAVVFVLDAVEIGVAVGRHTDSAEDLVLLLRDDGEILARLPARAEAPQRLDPDRPLMRVLANGETSGTIMGIVPTDGHPVAVAYQRVGTIPELLVTVGRRRAEVVERWRQVMVPLLLVGAPAVLALMGLALVVRRQQDALEAALEGLEQRVAERTDSLREGEERLRLAVEAGELGTWETDLRSGLSTRSPRAMEIMGLPADCAASPVAEWTTRIHPADRRRVLDLWDRLVTGRDRVYRTEYRFQRPDGTWRWLESSGTVGGAR